MRVNGSFRIFAQIQHDSEGVMKVMTVASARGRYSNESGEGVVSMEIFLRQWKSQPTIHSKDAEEATNASSNQEPSDLRKAKGKVGDLGPPHIRCTEGGCDGHPHE